MADFISEYFVNPIFERSGYNLVNTLTYAAIALFALYFIWRFMRGKKYDFSGKEFLFAVGAFVLFGSTCRVVTDLYDSGAAGLPAFFEYGYLTVSPGIYIVTAALFLSALAIGRLLKNEKFAAYAGLALFLPCLLLLLPHALHYDFAALIIAIAAAGSAVCYFLLERFARMKLALHEKLAIFGQALDGAATFVVIDVFAPIVGKGYFEQHVLSAGIGELTPLGFGLFFLLKITLASLIVYFLSKEKMDGRDKSLVLIVVAIMGFAPGIRDMLRMLLGV